MALPFSRTGELDGVEFRITGRKQLQTSLRKYGERAGVALRTNITKYQGMVASLARQWAPVRTGRLRASIHPTPITSTKRYNLYGKVEASAPYAAWVEFGAGRGRKNKNKARRRTAYHTARRVTRGAFGVKRTRSWGLIGQAVAQGDLAEYKRPYLGPALEAIRSPYYQAVAEILWDEAKRIQRGGR